MESIIQNIPAILSVTLLIVAILVALTNIITQVLKKATWDKLPTNILALIVAMAVTLIAFFAVLQIFANPFVWYMVPAAVALGFMVAYAAMFGFDKLREVLKQIEAETKAKE